MTVGEGDGGDVGDVEWPEPRQPVATRVTHSAATVATSLTAFVLIYTVVFSIGIYYIHKLIAKGPAGATLEPAPLPEGLPNRPLSVADESLRRADTQGPPTRTPEPLA